MYINGQSANTIQLDVINSAIYYKNEIRILQKTNSLGIVSLAHRPPPPP